MVVKTETLLFSSRQTCGAVSEDHLPLSNASLMRLTSLCEPGTLNIPSWWRPDGHTHSNYYYTFIHAWQSIHRIAHTYTNKCFHLLILTAQSSLSMAHCYIRKKLTHHEGLWNGCSFQPPQESAAQSSGGERWVEERWDERRVLKVRRGDQIDMQRKGLM